MDDKPKQVLKSRDITLPTKVHLVKVMVFPVVMYGCESWTIKKAECQKSDAFELRCWRRLLRVPWTARRSKQSILKEINPEYSLEGLMLKLILWPPDVKSWLIRKNPDAVKAEGDDRGWDGWMTSPTQWIWVWASSRRWWRTGKRAMLWSMGSQRVGHGWPTERQQWLYNLPLLTREGGTVLEVLAYRVPPLPGKVTKLLYFSQKKKE